MAPDMATVDAGVDTNAANANDAISRNNVIYERVVAALERLGIARGEIALAYYNVNYNPPPRTAQPNSGERYGYTVSRSFTVKVREIGKAGAVSDACTTAGATAINGVSFGLADSAGARASATVKAVADAHERRGARTGGRSSGRRHQEYGNRRRGAARSGADDAHGRRSESADAVRPVKRQRHRLGQRRFPGRTLAAKPGAGLQSRRDR